LSRPPSRTRPSGRSAFAPRRASERRRHRPPLARAAGLRGRLRPPGSVSYALLPRWPRGAGYALQRGRVPRRHETRSSADPAAASSRGSRKPPLVASGCSRGSSAPAAGERLELVAAQPEGAARVAFGEAPSTADPRSLRSRVWLWSRSAGWSQMGCTFWGSCTDMAGPIHVESASTDLASRRQRPTKE
jgi:hypothetical protein